MLCQKCNIKTATKRLIKHIDNKKSIVYLCDECVSSYTNTQSFLEDEFTSITDTLLLKSMISEFQVGHADSLACPSCGMTFSEITETGRFGCMQCYATFLPQVRPLLRKIHGNCLHRGALPAAKRETEKETGKSSNEIEIAILRAKLEKAVKDEEYELAAQLRDMIEALEKQGADE